MQCKTDGLVIREINVGESDRIVHILTREKGVVRASARGARKVRSRISSAAQMLTHSDFTLFRGRELYIIDEAAPLHFFLGVRRDLDRLALAQYFAQLMENLAPQEDEAEIYLRLILNALYLIENEKRPPQAVKAAFELRLLTLAGYMPDLVACRRCGAYEAGRMWFDPVEGNLICDRCAPEEGVGADGESRPLSPGALAAMRHAVYVDFSRLFSFELPASPLREFGQAAERYVCCRLERSFPTLEFYHEIHRRPPPAGIGRPAGKVHPDDHSTP